jgi:protease stability complex PrcB-like protein
MALRRLAVWILLTAPAIAGCAGPAAPTQSTPLTLVRFRADASSFLSYSGYDVATNLVIRGRAQFLQAWAQLYKAGPTSLPPPLPEIDFSTEMVVLTALGNQPSSGYDVIIDRATEADGVVTVDVTARRPGNCAALTVITTPVDLARLSRRDGPVVFRMSPVTTTCR